MEHQAIEQLKSLVSKVHQINETELNEFASLWKPFAAKRKTVLTKEGETEKYLYFVIKGVQRAFYIKKTDDKEATLVFTYPNSFSGIADSFLLQQPSKYFLETLTESQFIRITFSQLNELMKKYHDIETFIRKSLSYTLAGVLERQIELQCFTAEEKFRVY